MSLPNMLQYGFFLLIVVVLVKPVGGYLAHVFERQHTFLDSLLRPVERLLYRAAGVDPQQEMDWKQYASAFVLFSLVGTLLLYAILRLQPLLHTFDPTYQPTALAPDLAMNTAISFATTTTWQAYGGETTMSYFSQIAGSQRKTSWLAQPGWRWGWPLSAGWRVSAAVAWATSGSIWCARRCGCCCPFR